MSAKVIFLVLLVYCYVGWTAAEFSDVATTDDAETHLLSYNDNDGQLEDRFVRPVISNK